MIRLSSADVPRRLRALGRGLYPAVLACEGPAAAVETLAALAPLPVATSIQPARHPAAAEAAAYFVIAEALANVRHSRATRAEVTARTTGRLLTVEVRAGVLQLQGAYPLPRPTAVVMSGTPLPPLAPNSLTFVERGLETLDGTGLGDADKLRVIGLLSSYTLSEARMAHDAARANAQAQAAAAGSKATPPWSFQALLRELVDEQTYPRLHRIAWSSDIGGDASGSLEQEEFLFGIDRILDGVQTLIDRSPQHR